MSAIIELTNGEMHEVGKPFTPDINLIAKCLANTNRYNGSSGTISVAEHSLLVSHIVPQEHQLAALLHDAAEAYLGDMLAPIKELLPDFVALENFYHQQINKAFGVDVLHEEITKADKIAYVTECRDLGRKHTLPGIEPHSKSLWGFSPDAAEYAFILRFNALIGGSHG